ncbi:ABC transporter permease [Nocardioides caldifontis]|uniref:ABC transporter permease n=1 Tax=Nocardioides caldifontis TaxID=2588938 RepID=UPI0011DF3AF3|nr:ABC transporter permease [Nocardioides caldifontis]
MTTDSKRKGIRLPRPLAIFVWAYMVWNLLPVVAAMAFSFNATRSRSQWQGFSTQWWSGTPLSLFDNEEYTAALKHSLELAAMTTVISTVLGTLLALVVTRIRGVAKRPVNFILMIPIVTPELILAVGLYLSLTFITVWPFSVVELGTPAQVVGQVTYTVGFVVVIIRGRIAVLGDGLEAAARDLGAGPIAALVLVLFRLLMPAVLVGAMISFAFSIDNFVITQYLSSDSSTVSIPMYLYTNARGGNTTPALNALATVLVVTTLLAVALASLLYRWATRRESVASDVTGTVALSA